MHYTVIIASADTELSQKLTSVLQAGLESVEVICAADRDETLRRYTDLRSRHLQPASVVIDSSLKESEFVYSKLLFDREKEVYSGSIVACNTYPGWIDRYMNELRGDVDLEMNHLWLLPLHIQSGAFVGSIVHP